MDKFEEEFNVLQIVDSDFDMDDLDCVRSRLNCSLMDLKDIDNEIVSALRKDFRFKFTSKTFNKLPFIFGIYDEKMYDEDIRILNQHRSLVERFGNCFEALIGVLNEENCRDILKLAVYTELKYGENHEYYVGKRNEYVLYCDGIYCCFNRDCDEEEFLEFFNKQLEEFKTNKAVSKVKSVGEAGI